MRPMFKRFNPEVKDFGFFAWRLSLGFASVSKVYRKPENYFVFVIFGHRINSPGFYRNQEFYKQKYASEKG